VVVTSVRATLNLLAAAIVVTGCSGSDSTATSESPTTTQRSATAPASTTPASTAPATTHAPAATTLPAPEYDFSAIDPIVSGFVAEKGLNGAGLIVVDRDHGVIHEDYWGELGPDRISLVASSSKMVTAGVLLRLQDDGLLDIDMPIAEYVDWGAGNPDVTVAQLLSNSSGLVGLLDDPGYRPYICQFQPTGTLQECAESIFTTDADDADIVPPDTKFRYGGAQWQVAGAVAEAVSGKTWDELIDEIYIEPCGLDALGFNNHFAQIPGGFTYPDQFDGDPSVLQPTDNPNIEGGMYTTTGDYAALLLMHLRGGRCGNTQVLSQEALDLMHADRIGDVYGGNTFFGPDSGYGMGWWVDRATGRISDSGAYGSVPWLDLADGYGALLVIEANSATGNELATLLYEPVEEAVLGGA
jgi:CubicO group peptidase (beta-lactamase class C family)